MKLSDLTTKPSPLSPGYRTCSGCPIATIVRHVLRASAGPFVVAVNTGCLEVTTTVYPQTAWKVPLVHSLLENGAATISGLEAAAKVLRAKGKLKGSAQPKFVVFAGDGSTYDAGLQFLSAAIERGHDFLYVCYDNQAYMNTGVQKSGATPRGAYSTTTPAGHQRNRKDIMQIVAAHNIPYAAQATLWHWQDFYQKAKTGLETPGPAFLNVLSPCVPGWKIDPAAANDLSRLAVATRYWPLYEVVSGKYKITVPVAQPEPLEEFLKLQGRFKHLLTPAGQAELNGLKKNLTDNWQRLEKLSKLTV